MLKKLNLDATKTYEKHIAAAKIADMLVDFVLGHSHILEIGTEQGDILKWDDVVILWPANLLEHIQVKRNFKDFSDEPCFRNTYTKNTKHKQVGQLKDLSPLDESIEELAKWTSKNNPANTDPKRKFTVCLPDWATQIKTDFTTGDFYNVLRSITASTTATSMQTAANADPKTKKCYEWLTTWCGFTDWNHILLALRHLTLKANTEDDLKSNAMGKLKICFSNEADVWDQINIFIDDNATFTSSMTPRPLFGKLKPYWLPDLKSWTQYTNNGGEWSVSGTNDHNFDSVENPAQVVPALWTGQHSNEVKLDCDAAGTSTMPSAIRRLILHLPNLRTAHVKDSAVWIEKTKHLLGGTLGLGEEDLTGIPVVECLNFNQSADSESIKSRNNVDAYAETLSTEMDKVNWLLICKKIESKFDAMAMSDLRTAMDARWKIWEAGLNANPATQATLFREMFRPASEGDELDYNLRIGTKTVSEIVKGLFLLMAVSVAVSDADHGWSKLNNELTVGTKALKYWSGPSGKKRRARLLSDEDGIEDFIGKEGTKVLVLSGIQETVTALTSPSLAETTNQSVTMASAHRPSLIITDSSKIRSLIQSGDLTGLKAYIKQIIVNMNTIKSTAINTITS